MTARTTLTMSNGKGIDLLHPRVLDIDFVSVAEHLAKDNRYCGATKGLVYSVAEHSVRCADVALQIQPGNRTLAGYMLTHDMHEAFLGDDTTPKKQALAQIAQVRFGVLNAEIMGAFADLTDRLDKVIHDAAGLAWPPPFEMRGMIKHFDKLLLATEWRYLMRCAAPYDFEIEPLPEPIDPMDWQDAAHELVKRCADLLPGFAVHQALVRRGEAS